METRANHVLIGVFTLAGLVLIVLIALWSARFVADSAWTEYEVVFEHPVSGLSVGSTVQYNGINMGTVRDLHLDVEDPRRVIARIRLDAAAPVRADTVARLTVSGLTGVAFIQLRGGSPESPPLAPEADGTPPRIMAEESALQRLIDTSEDIASMVSEVMLRLLDFLSEENAERVADALDNIDRLSDALLKEGDLIADTIRNVHQGSERIGELLDGSLQLIGELSGALSEIDSHLIVALPEMTEDLSATLRQLASVSARIDRLLDDNEAAFADLGSEVIMPLAPAVEEFRQLVRELSRLSARLERDPSGFLLGGSQTQEYEPK